MKLLIWNRLVIKIFLWDIDITLLSEIWWKRVILELSIGERVSLNMDMSEIKGIVWLNTLTPLLSIQNNLKKALDFYGFYYYINMYLKIGCYDDRLFVKNTSYENRCESNRGLTRIRRRSVILKLDR